MNNFFTFGCGQGATKAMIHCIEEGTLQKEHCCVVNSTVKDIPEEYRNGAIIISEDQDAGCGKVRSYAKKLMVNYLKKNPNEILAMIGDEYQYVNIMATTEGASGSGASVVLAKFIESQLEIPVIITLISGFESDTRGLQNTIEYFKDLNGGNFVVRTVSNKKYLEKTNNTFTAEKMANDDISTAFKVISAQDIIDSEQNIDDTDHYKLITNPGMMFVTEVLIDRKLKNPAQFEQLISDAIDYNTSLDFEPSATKIGVFMNISDDKLAIIDTNFTTIKKKLCGNNTVDEFFIHRQYNAADPEYVRIIASGMNLPKEELLDIYNKYQNTKTATSKKDDFFDSISDMDTSSVTDKRAKSKVNDDFFAQFDTEEDSEDDEVVIKRGKRKNPFSSSPISNSNVNTTNVTGGYEKKKSFTAHKTEERKSYSEDDMKGF
jgi:hypothetical protein